jgi:hypothetical protein
MDLSQPCFPFVLRCLCLLLFNNLFPGRGQGSPRPPITLIELCDRAPDAQQMSRAPKPWSCRPGLRTGRAVAFFTALNEGWRFKSVPKAVEDYSSPRRKRAGTVGVVQIA